MAVAARGDRPSAAATTNGSPRRGRWLAEHEAKEILRAAAVPVVDGRVVTGEDDAVAALAELGGLVAVKASHPEIRHKAAVGAVAIDLSAEPDVRAAYRSLHERGAVLVERMAAPGAELIVSVRRDAVVPALVVGLGGAYAELLDEVAIVPLPASAERVERELRRLRGGALLRHADLPAAARLAARLAELPGLELVECNPVLVHNEGAVVVDAVAKEISA
jgi:succinyl-CoA synthetase beta subunit